METMQESIWNLWWSKGLYWHLQWQITSTGLNVVMNKSFPCTQYSVKVIHCSAHTENEAYMNRMTHMWGYCSNLSFKHVKNLKQTEVDCEFLKRCCESLTDENKRLQKELQELRALKLAFPLYMQMPATTLTMCPSCEIVVPAENNRRRTSGHEEGCRVRSQASFVLRLSMLHYKVINLRIFESQSLW